MIRRHRIALLALAAAVLPSTAFAGKRAEQRARAEPTPSWSTPDGRERARLDLVVALIDGGRNEEALQLIGQLRRDGKPPVEIDVLQAKALREVGLYDESEEMLRSYLKHNGRDGDAHNELGILLMERQRVPEAAASFELATRFAPESAEFKNNLGFALLTTQQPTEAVAALKAALKLDGSSALARNNLGFALVAADRSDEAYRVFRSAGTDADAHYNVGVGLELRGEGDAAAKRYERALKADPKHPQARAAMSRVGAPPQQEKAQ